MPISASQLLMHILLDPIEDHVIAIRKIEPTDNVEIARVIRSILEEFGVARPGTVYTDPTTDALYELFQTPGSIYYIAETNGKIIGGCGIYPTQGLPSGYAELVKLYLLPESRGKGIGKKLMQESMAFAITYGYTHLYLETMPELAGAIDLYHSLGYREIDGPLGETGHFACEIRMVVDI